MMDKLKQEEEKLKKAENTIVVMTMLKEGTVPETVATAGEFTACNIRGLCTHTSDWDSTQCLSYSTNYMYSICIFND